MRVTDVDWRAMFRGWCMGGNREDEIVTSQIHVNDQIAALRKQIATLSEAAKVPLDADFKALEDLVASEKAKKEKKVVVKKKV